MMDETEVIEKCLEENCAPHLAAVRQMGHQMDIHCVN
jgi:hypothetical protein